jgi:hypothetical protein
MSDDQIEYLKKLLHAGFQLAVVFGDRYREIISICDRREAHEGPEGDEPAANFDNGEYAALWACEPSDIVIFDIRPVDYP